ncbi:MAG: hypothetical protein EBX36_09710, partial [Planctomycetia bacterium]|nr:hypothetical protein [Planctomycetia bacterium]
AIRSHVVVGDPLSLGRTLQNVVFGPNNLLTDDRGRAVLPPMLAAPGTVILHAPRRLNTHVMSNFPDY